MDRNGRGIRGSRDSRPTLFGLRQVLLLGETILPWVKDLLECCQTQERIQRGQHPGEGSGGALDKSAMSPRDAKIGLRVLQQEELILRRDLEHVGVKIGDLTLGETLFPTMVDGRRAYFIWILGEARPTAWRFRGERHCHRIPERWFLGASDSHSMPGPKDSLP